jgi:hypothetical protein
MMSNSSGLDSDCLPSTRLPILDNFVTKPDTFGVNLDICHKAGLNHVGKGEEGNQGYHRPGYHQDREGSSFLSVSPSNRLVRTTSNHRDSEQIQGLWSDILRTT